MISKDTFQNKTDQKADAAQEYARMGWQILPMHTVLDDGSCDCENGAKCQETGSHPINGYNVDSATNNIDAVGRWWRDHPSANVSVLSGESSGIVAVMLSCPKDARLADCAGRDWPETPVIAGAGFKYVLFQYPEYTIPRSFRIGSGMHICGQGDLVPLPPSVESNPYRKPSRTYSLEWEVSPFEGISPQPLPDSLYTHIYAIMNNGGVPPPRTTQSATSTPERTTVIDDVASAEPVMETMPIEDTPVVITAPVQPTFEYDPEDTHPTQLGNARRLVQRHGHNIRYCHDKDRHGWLHWDGTHWAWDETGMIETRAKDTVCSIYAEAAKLTDSKDREALGKHAARSESEKSITAMIHLAQTEQGIPVRLAEMDANPWMLNVVNGTLDLRTGELREHRKEDMITKVIPIHYDPNAKCPRWEAFLREVMDGDEGMVQFIQRAVGYSLTGDTTEQEWFLMHGEGANGKSTFIETILAVMRAYGSKIRAQTLLSKNRDGVPNDIARLTPFRYVAAVEPEQQRRINDALLKELTGSDTIISRFLFKEEFAYRPQFKLWVAANHMPNISDTTLSTWRRINVIPFEVTIPEDKQDKRLQEKLAAELDGILAWAVRGCMEWQKAGLNPPEKCKRATAEYRDEMDNFGRFIQERCVINRDGNTSAKDLYSAYHSWCWENGEEPVSQKAFGLRLKGVGLAKYKAGGGCIHWCGIRLRSVTM